MENRKTEEKKDKTQKRHLPKLSAKGAKAIGAELVAGLREIVLNKKTITEKNKLMEEFYEYDEVSKKDFKKTIKDRLEAYTRGELVSFGAVLITLIYVVLLCCRYVDAFSIMHTSVLCNNIFYILLSILLPFGFWIAATNENYWSFHNRKMFYFYLCFFNLCLSILQPVYTLCRNIAVALAGKLKPSAILSPATIVLCAQILTMLFFAAILVVAYSQLEPLFTSQGLKRQIKIFKLKHHVDTRRDKEYLYDLHIVKDLESGANIAIKEIDRFVQMLIIGASGTGKTSSTILPAIVEDLDQILRNMEKRMEEYLKLIRDGRLSLKKGCLRGKDVPEDDDFIPIGTQREIKATEEKLKEIRRRFTGAGITVVAPNASLNEEIIKLCQARGINVNVLDPVNDYSDKTKYPNVKEVSMNPFYVPLDLKNERERVIYIANASTMFAEVLIATNQADGKGDPYFTDLSLTICSNISTIIMLAKNIKGEQASLDDIQECINDFSLINPYVKEVEEYFDIYVQEKVSTKGQTKGEDIKNNAPKVSNRQKRNTKKNPYYMVILFIKQELIGPGAEDLFPQARGLRNLINKIVVDPRVKEKLTVEEGEMLNFDKILSNNEITIVNTAIELGAATSTAFGLFFILLHKISVLRRPKGFRSPHFLWIDEATQYMHPCYEDMIALYRQFRCAVSLALQSLDQVEKNASTRYLKDVFLSAGTHIAFGRLSPEEMKILMEMGGTKEIMEEQYTVTGQSVFSTDPTASHSVRSALSRVNNIEGSDMRIRDFQEITIMTLDNGRVLPSRHAKVFFVSPDAFLTKISKKVKWEKAAPEAFMECADHREDTQKEENRMAAETAVPEDRVRTVVSTTRETVPIEDKEEPLIDYSALTPAQLMALIQAGAKEEPQRTKATSTQADKKTADTREGNSDNAKMKKTDYERELDKFNDK